MRTNPIANLVDVSGAKFIGASALTVLGRLHATYFS
jgi:hypothetical protein